MSNINLYATVAEFKAYFTSRNAAIPSNVADDNVISYLLEMASRYIDDKTSRKFYPSIETMLYDTPTGMDLCLDNDLLEVITLTNGDGTSLASTQYVLETANKTPYWNIRLRSSVGYYWSIDSVYGREQAIELNAWFGYHNQYSQRAWKLAGTLGAAITDTTTLAFTMSASHTVLAGHIVKIGTEIYNVDSVNQTTVTPIVRGDNGSTAATHSNGASVYVWQPMPDVKNACIEITNAAYHKRFGQNVGESATITAAGVVLSPKDVPQMAADFIRLHGRKS